MDVQSLSERLAVPMPTIEEIIFAEASRLPPLEWRAISKHELHSLRIGSVDIERLCRWNAFWCHEYPDHWRIRRKLSDYDSMQWMLRLWGQEGVIFKEELWLRDSCYMTFRCDSLHLPKRRFWEPGDDWVQSYRVDVITIACDNGKWVRALVAPDGKTIHYWYVTHTQKPHWSTNGKPQFLD